MLYAIFSVFFFFKQKTAYEMRISDWSSDVCSSDLAPAVRVDGSGPRQRVPDAEVGRQVDIGMAERAQRDVVGRPRADARQREQAAPYVVAVQIGRASCRERVCPYV